MWIIELYIKVLSHRKRASDAAMRLTEKLDLYILMMYSHWRVTTRAKSIVTVIARIDTTHI